MSARALPWRGERDPYRIWISEIMLQQTRAETVIPYYRAFLADFPDVRALADADMEALLKRWEGLGYYTRARNLRAAARQIVERFGGALPDTAEGLRSLPGIGEYTAGAIASIAYGKPTPAIDGNQIRVLARLFDMRERVDGAAGKRALRACAEALIDPLRPGDFNQALMGLGALCCIPTKPDCARCPLHGLCEAEAAGNQTTLPSLPPRIRQRVEQRAVALVFLGDRVYVRRRPDTGLLASLWEFPSFENARDKAAVAEALREIGLPTARIELGDVAEHVFTHIVWRMRGYLCRARHDVAPDAGRFVDLETLDALALPTALAAYRAVARARLLEGAGERD